MARGLLTRWAMRTLSPLLGVLLAALGCASDGDHTMSSLHQGDGADASSERAPDAMPVNTCPGTSVELGTGVREYQAVADGDTVYLYRGPQGGYMIYLSVRVRGLNPNDVMLCYKETFTSTGKDFGAGCWHIILTNDLGDGVHERVGVWGQVDSKYWTIPNAIRGSDASVAVTVADNLGCSAAATWSTVHISSDPGM